jgi:hypothetical protein
MAKSKKNESAAIGFGPVLKVFFLCSVIGGSAVGYVWQKSQIYELGRQIRQNEIRLTQLKGDNQRLTDQLAILRSPVMVDERAKQLNLGLVPAQPGQVYRLPEPALEVPESNRSREIAGRLDGPPLTQ